MSSSDDNGPLGRIRTLDEAAAELRMCRRALQNLIARHPHYACNGRRKLFSDDDIRALWEAMREPARERQQIIDARAGAPLLGPEKAFARLLEMDRRRKKERAESRRKRRTSQGET